MPNTATFRLCHDVIGHHQLQNIPIHAPTDIRFSINCGQHQSFFCLASQKLLLELCAGTYTISIRKMYVPLSVGGGRYPILHILPSKNLTWVTFAGFCFYPMFFSGKQTIFKKICINIANAKSWSKIFS